MRLPQSTPGSADGEESCYCLKLGVDNSKGQQQWLIGSEREEWGVVLWSPEVVMVRLKVTAVTEADSEDDRR